MICELEDKKGNMVADQKQIAEILVKFFHQKFQYKEVNIDESLLDVIPNLVSDQDQDMIKAIPEVEEIKNAVFVMNADGAPGPDSFSVNGAKKPNQFRPIGLSNFIFKIFTKILTTRMNALMSKLVSQQQAAYIKGRSIHEQVMLASGLVNEMKHTRRWGNVGLKLDISQAYDSVSWDFLFKVLQKYGFSAAWCDWLKTLFASAKISVMINGGPQGFFSMERGLKHGDPLSPIPFVLMEEVLSRNLTKLVELKMRQPMVIRKGVYPTHLFFADDVFIFSNGSKKILVALITLLKNYQDNSGQIINKQKSKCFVDGCTPSRKNQILNLLQMELTTFPDKYLGVILKPGRVKSETVWPMVEMMQSYLAAWKGKMLSFNDRLVLIKSVLCSVPIYNMTVYKWPSSVIKICEKIIRNFLWTGDSEVRKHDTLGWSKVCAPFTEGGLGIRSLEVINKDLLMKMMWNFMNSSDECSSFFAAKYKDKYGQWSTQWRLSTVWPGLKWAWMETKSNVRWNVGNGENISLWFDTWVGDKPLIDSLNCTARIQDKLHMSLKKLETSIQNYIGLTKFGKKILHLSIASNARKIQQEVYTDDVKLVKKGYSLASKCCICQQSQDSMEHLMWSCSFSKHIWQWLVSIFQFQIPTSFSDIIILAKQKSPIVRQVWITTACATMRELWFQKNKFINKSINPNLEYFKRKIMNLVFYGGYRMIGTRWGQNYDSEILQFFNLGQRNIRFKRIQECQWFNPSEGIVLFFCAGMTVGNPGMGGFGIIARGHDCQVIGTVSGGTGIATTHIDDALSIVWAIEWAVKLQCSRILIRSHSLLVIEDAKKGVMPWCLQSRWVKDKKEIPEIIYEQCYKEVNFSAMELAKQGAGLSQGSVVVTRGKPYSLSQVELPDRKYYIFC
ncbi:uncharacterized protein LOC113352064 [Papaver somniferum]|uniref:uncharacterized protein LOC113352064 n=1 Tax=Papaver somniferum TaxID=3469 RepID=UPI000E6F8525|nr:uncharacterized protein LOC113352064 [Papaver somniferum]